MALVIGLSDCIPNSDANANANAAARDRENALQVSEGKGVRGSDISRRLARTRGS